MFFTVTVQTYNRADLLRSALHSLAALQCPPDLGYEILVVDNNSTDHTAAVLEEYDAALGPRFRHVFEPRQGLSHARNRAIQEARGDVLCFMDDDAVADRGWLAGHAAAYHADAQTAAVGGPIRLQWPEGHTRPPWLGHDLEGYLGYWDIGAGDTTIEYPRYPYGCNMSVRRDLARDVGGFSVRLGRTEGQLLSNEEKLFFYRIHQQRGRVVYAPDAVVHHVVAPERLSKGFFLRRAYAQGASDVAFRREVTPEHDGPGSRARAFFGGLRLFGTVCLRTSGNLFRTRDAATRFLHLARSAYAAGYLSGAAGLFA